MAGPHIARYFAALLKESELCGLVSCPRNNLTLDERILDAREPRYA